MLAALLPAVRLAASIAHEGATCLRCKTVLAERLSSGIREWPNRY